MQVGRLAIAIGACFVFSGIACAQDSLTQRITALHWVEGPSQVKIGDNATFQVPSGYRFLGPADTTRFMELTKNLPPGDGATIFAPDDFHWWGMFEYNDAGHVADKEKIDADALLSSLRDSQEEANKQLSSRGWATLQVTGWKYKPFYDNDTHNLSWAIALRNSNGGEDVNYNTRLLGRTGYTAATLVAGSTGLQSSVDQFKGVVSGYQYDPDQTYAAFKPGDKVAEYGLAALITGGAVAVAAKTGFWKVIVGAILAGWKLIAAAAVAVFAAGGRALKRIFRGGSRA